MPNLRNFLHIDDIHFNEEEKNSFDYLQRKIDYYIYHLVHEKKDVKKARNLYEGIRDEEEYAYLQSTFGIEQPISLKMTPIIKTRIDILIGIFLEETRRFLVTINDEGTHDKINEAKKQERVSRIITKYNQALANTINRANNNQPPAEEDLDAVSKDFLEKMEQSLNDDFISEFEIAAHILIKHFEQNSEIDLEQKLKLLFLDLLITGQCYYRVHPEILGDDPVLEVCKPENVFFNKNTNSQYLDTDAVVHRKFMKRSDILVKYGHFMSDEMKQELYGGRPGIEGGRAIHSGYEVEYVHGSSHENGRSLNQQFTYDNNDILEVYEIEWLAANEYKLSEEEQMYLKSTEKMRISAENRSIGWLGLQGDVRKQAYRVDRYFGIRIGTYMYLNCGKAKHDIRSQHNPYKTKLTYNGIGYNERNSGKPYSLPAALKDLQDLYDITMFHRDNLIAHSGVNGSRINLAGIPKVLGENFMERVQKFIAYRKQGLEFIDPTEPGSMLFQHYGDFRASVDGNVIASLDTVLESLERQADIVSGVNRFMYQAAEQRDAVSNVKVGVQQTSLITKDLFKLMSKNITHILHDMLNAGKITYKYGKKGSYILGGKTYLFDLMPEQFCFTDYNINIVNSQKEIIKLEKITNTVKELIGAGLIDPELAILINTTESTTEIIRMVRQSLREIKEKNNNMAQMSQQIEEMDNALKQSQTQLQQYESQIQKLNKASSEMEMAKFKAGREDKSRELALKEKESELREKEAMIKEKLANSEIEKDKAVVALEREQIYAENADAREVKNDL